MFKKRKSLTLKKSAGRFSLGFKLSLSITLLIMFLMFVIGMNSFFRNRATLLEEAQSRGWLTARTTSAFAADYIRGNNTALLGNIIDHLERDPFIKNVVVMDLQGNILMSSDEKLKHSHLDSPELQQAMNTQKDTLKYRSDLKGHPLALEFIAPIAPRDAAPVGYFWMEADLTYISNYLIASAYNQILTSILAILAGLIISRLIILRLIQRPVKELVNATDRVSTGDFSGEVQVWNRDELGRLAEAFNTMTGHLGVLFQSIRTSVNDISATAQVIINRSEQSDLVTRKLAASLDQLQRSASELPAPPGSTDIVAGNHRQLNETTEATLRQQEHLKEIRNSSKKLVRYIDRLDSISLQFKFNEK